MFIYNGWTFARKKRCERYADGPLMMARQSPRYVKARYKLGSAAYFGFATKPCVQEAGLSHVSAR